MRGIGLADCTTTFFPGPSSTSVDPSREESLTFDRREGSSRRPVVEGVYVDPWITWLIVPFGQAHPFILILQTTVEGIQDQVYPQVNDLIGTRGMRVAGGGEGDISSWTTKRKETTSKDKKGGRRSFNPLTRLVSSLGQENRLLLLGMLYPLVSVLYGGFWGRDL